MFSQPTEPVDFQSASAVTFMWGVEEMFAKVWRRQILVIPGNSFSAKLSCDFDEQVSVWLPCEIKYYQSQDIQVTFILSFLWEVHFWCSEYI